MSNRFPNLENIIMDYFTNSFLNEDANNQSRQNDAIIGILNKYQRNMELYSNNVREMISFIRQSREHTSVNNVRPTQSANNAYWTRSFRAPPGRTDMSANDIHTRIPTHTTNAPVYGLSNPIPTPHTVDRRLTDIEVDESITEIMYSDEQNELLCPISLEDFTIGEPICKINRCGHIFKRDVLYRWLDSHSKCPVCRCSICREEGNREHTSNTPTNPLSDNNNSNIDDFVNAVAYNLLASINTNPSSITRSPNRDTRSRTFDISIYYDMSGNMI